MNNKIDDFWTKKRSKNTERKVRIDWTNVVCPNCKSIEDYNVNLKNGHQVCRCNQCDYYLGCKPNDHITEKDLTGVFFPFGKYKGHLISEVTDLNYLEWLRDKSKLRDNNIIKQAVVDQIKKIYNH